MSKRMPVTRKYLERFQTLAFRRQAAICGCGLIRGGLQGGWDPLNLLGAVFVWYAVVILVTAVVFAAYDKHLAGPDDHVSLETFFTIVSLVLFVGSVLLHAHENGWLPQGRDDDGYN